MPELAIRLPARRPDLVLWKAAENGHYLVRDRRAGESYALGDEEYFLLERLDGRHTADELCRAFAAQFSQPLSDDDLADFLELAHERGLLQPGGAAATPPPAADGFGERLHRPAPARRPDLPRRAASRLLAAAAAALQWPAGLLQTAAEKIKSFRLRRLDFVPRPDDVFIVTYPRSGTTWMQMILYQLTTDGSMDIPHIAEFCPWFERSQRSGRAFETRPSPRLFKSHLAYRDIPRGPGKYIYVARDGRDVAVSYYHLYRNYNGYEGTFAEFFDLFVQGKVGYGSWFEHVRGWWARRHDRNVLLLTYEELQRDLEGCVRRIIAFCGFDVPAERLPGILERCGFAFMKRHEKQFDPALETLWEQGIRLNGFLRNGRAGEGTVRLSGEQAARFDRVFGRRLGRTGYAL